MQPGNETTSADPLTGLPRREVLRQRLLDDCGRTWRLHKTLSLLAIDLDQFAKINERYLIPGGDQILARVARMIRHAARPGDLVVRDGGDQFTIVLDDADWGVAAAQAERIRTVVAATPIAVHLGGCVRSAHVTVSVGVATLTRHDVNAWEVFERARTAAHDAKALGGDRFAIGYRGPV